MRLKASNFSHISVWPCSVRALAMSWWRQEQGRNVRCVSCGECRQLVRSKLYFIQGSQSSDIPHTHKLLFLIILRISIVCIQQSMSLTPRPALSPPLPGLDDQHGKPDEKRHPKRPREPSRAIYPRKRALAACEICRKRKSKCDNLRPTCGLCHRLNAHCVYRDSAFDHSTWVSPSFKAKYLIFSLLTHTSHYLKL
jgi:hypothetical protein